MFPDLSLQITKNKIDILIIINIMKTLYTHTIYSQPNLIWEGRCALLEDTDVG